MPYLLNDAIYSPKISPKFVETFDVLLTRYNARSAARIATREWVENRSVEFENVCLASMLKLRVKPDTWMILFDGENREYVTRILDILKPHDWIMPIWQDCSGDKPETVSSAFNREIKARMPKSAEYLRTTRVDNDDALSRHYFELVEAYSACVIEQRKFDDFWIIFPFGAQATREEGRIYMHTSPHFASRCVSRSLLDVLYDPTVMALNHREIVNASHTFSPVTRQPMWLQNVHGDNVSNEMIKHNLRVEDIQGLKRIFGL